MKREIREKAFRRNPMCKIAESKGIIIKATELHHARIHDTKWGRSKYPLFMDSLFNLVPVSHDMHMVHGSWGKWSEARCAVVERGLERHEKHRQFLCG